MRSVFRRYRSALPLLLAAAFAGAAPAASAAQQLYTCGMHPQVIKTEPGDCPICHMKLTPLVGSGGGAVSSGGAAAALSTIHIDTGTIQRMNLKTQVVEREAAQREIRTVGVVAFDERTRFDITTRFDGWIEKLFVNAAWQRVKAGDPLFEIYSPALYNAQLNYLVALRSEGEQGGSLTDASLQRLHLLGVPESFIDALKTRATAERNYVYRAPADGVVTEKFVKQGQMITAGQPIYSFAGLAEVWVEAQVYEKDFALVKPGQPVRVLTTYGENRAEAIGEVSEILPQIQEATRSAIARIILENKDEVFLPGMFTDVRFKIDLGDAAVLVPDEAVLRSGEKNTVFVALEGGAFEPREVVLGPRTDDHRYVVRSGLQEGERVVVSGQFMLDSESRLREAIQKMIQAASSDGSAPDTAALHAAMGHSHGGASGSTGGMRDTDGKGGTDGKGKAAQAASASGAATVSSGNVPAQSGNVAVPPGNASSSAASAASSAAVASATDGCCGGSAVGIGGGDAASASGAANAAANRRDEMLRPPLVVLAFSAADASAALAADDLDGYRKTMPALRSALQTYLAQTPGAAQGPLGPFADDAALNDNTTLAAARDAFAPFSNALVGVAQSANLHRSGVIHIFECPMVPKVGTGRWLQRRNDDAYNPFFGADMLHCGGIVQ